MGIGAHVARAYAAVGANVVVASRTAEKMEALAAEIRATGGSALAVAADAGKAEDLERLAQAAEQAFGPVHILFFNATTGALPIDRDPFAADDAVYGRSTALPPIGYGGGPARVGFVVAGFLDSRSSLGQAGTLRPRAAR